MKSGKEPVTWWRSIEARDIAEGLMPEFHEHLLEESLVRLEQEFRDRFVRIHRSCLVARDYVERFERSDEDSGEGGWVVVLRGLDERLPVSRRQQHVIKDFGRLGGA